MKYALVACEESQRVTIELRRLGVEAYSCDIQECSGGHPEWHIQGDVLSILDGRCEFVTMDGKYHKIFDKWDLIIAHPPCTYLSNAGACRLYPRAGELDRDRYEKGMQAKAFFMTIWNADCDRVCIENPKSSKIFELPKKTQMIQPYQFGEPYSKRTYLWLRGLPPLEPTDILTEYRPWISSYTSANKGRPEKRGIAKTAKERSKTFPGIARAMAEQWTQYIREESDKYPCPNVN